MKMGMKGEKEREGNVTQKAKKDGEGGGNKMKRKDGRGKERKKEEGRGVEGQWKKRPSKFLLHYEMTFF